VLFTSNCFASTTSMIDHASGLSRSSWPCRCVSVGGRAPLRPPVPDARFDDGRLISVKDKNGFWRFPTESVDSVFAEEPVNAAAAAATLPTAAFSRRSAGPGECETRRLFAGHRRGTAREPWSSRGLANRRRYLTGASRRNCLRERWPVMLLGRPGGARRQAGTQNASLVQASGRRAVRSPLPCISAGFRPFS
jgi:hypothetical protein